MYHAHFHGTHYQIGFRWGAALAKHGQLLLQHAPFPITQQRWDFAAACLPVYQTYFPEILEEIQGLADGQRCDATLLQALLFSMYAIPPSCGCSCFALAHNDQILLGRNSDFLTALEPYNLNVLYRFSGQSYAFTGNTTAFLEMEDGVNRHGLAVGLTAVAPVAIQPGFNAGMLVRFFLEKCRSTAEVLHWLQRLPISSAQTITVADTQGQIAVIECNAQQRAILRPSEAQPFVCATNLFVTPALAQRQDPTLDSWQSEDRLHTLLQTLEQQTEQFDLQAAQDLLAGKTGFLCQYQRATGRDTVWSVIYDLQHRTIYRAEGNPSRHRFREDRRFSF